MIRSILNALFACVLSLGALAGHAAWYALIEKESALVARLEDQITIKTENASRAASARASLTEVESDETAIQGYFVSESGVVAFINELEAEGRELKAAVDVLSVSMSNEATEPTLVFAVAVEGDFDAVVRTVGAVEFASYALSVSNLSLRRGAKGGWRADMNFSVSSRPSAATTPS